MNIAHNKSNNPSWIVHLQSPSYPRLVTKLSHTNLRTLSECCDRRFAIVIPREPPSDPYHDLPEMELRSQPAASSTFFEPAATTTGPASTAAASVVVDGVSSGASVTTSTAFAGRSWQRLPIVVLPPDRTAAHSLGEFLDISFLENNNSFDT